MYDTQEALSFLRRGAQADRSVVGVGGRVPVVSVGRSVVRDQRVLGVVVRAIVGTMIDVGLGITSTERFHEILKSRDRREAGASAPANGLFLSQIIYDNTIFLLNGESK